jgi:signal transduction histidine kinase
MPGRACRAVAMSSPEAARATPAPTLAAVRLARSQRQMLVRRFRSAGLIMVAYLLVVAIRKSPGPGLHGESLEVLLGLIAVGVGGTALLCLPIPVGWLLVVPFVLLVAGSAVLVWVQPAGPGDIGAVIAAVAAVRVLPDWRSRVAAVASVTVVSLAFVLAAGVAHPKPDGHVSVQVFVGLIPGVLCVFVLFTRRLDRYSYQMERVLIDLEQAQNAEVRAVALAERQRLAREMHDVLAHSLSGLALQLEGARLLAAEDPADPRLAETIERAHHLARSGLLEARRAIGLLRDEQLPGPERLAALVAEFERDSGLPCCLTVDGDQHALDSQARLAVYRVAQEALTNVRKHADACRVELRLRYELDGTRLAVEDFRRDQAPRETEPVPVGAAVAAGGQAPPRFGAGADDSGNGRGEAGGAGGYGLTGMRERAELLGGTLTATKTCGGFLVELWLPE